MDQGSPRSGLDLVKFRDMTEISYLTNTLVVIARNNSRQSKGIDWNEGLAVICMESFSRSIFMPMLDCHLHSCGQKTAHCHLAALTAVQSLLQCVAEHSEPWAHKCSENSIPRLFASLWGSLSHVTDSTCPLPYMGRFPIPRIPMPTVENRHGPIRPIGTVLYTCDGT